MTHAACSTRSTLPSRKAVRAQGVVFVAIVLRARLSAQPTLVPVGAIGTPRRGAEAVAPTWCIAIRRHQLRGVHAASRKWLKPIYLSLAVEPKWLLDWHDTH